MRIFAVVMLSSLLLPSLLFAGEWVNDNAYRVVAPGVPDKNAADKLARRLSAKTVAVALARARVVEELAWILGGDSLDDPSGVLACRNAVFGAFRDAILAGRVVEERYGESDDCTITYEVETPGLRAKLTALRGSLKIPGEGTEGADADRLYRSLGGD
ncbi:MAG: hypothetical protein EPN93_08015 [Spirochaetes bacterium]|nr:MAG: hypothetical protein EPN93_08015 [Spirochaetota bacterium]